MKSIGLLLAGTLLAACSPSAEPAAPVPAVIHPIAPTARIVLVGDTMTGRGLAGLLADDAAEVFAGVRHLLTAADLAAGNLESPLTDKPHVSANENRLEADPSTAEALAAAGFDLMALPNNHSTDAGPDGLVDTMGALRSAGLLFVGAGTDAANAYEPTIVTTPAAAIGLLAYDATGVGTTAGAGPGVATWDAATAAAAVRDLRERVDVVVVSVHGGTEYLPTRDPGMVEIGEVLASAGADVVWGHGAHVVQPVTVTEGDRPTVVATSLGNFLFDQAGADRTSGYLLELMVNEAGLAAYRVGAVQHPERLLEFVEWLPPIGDAGWVDGSWWTLLNEPALGAATTAAVADFRHGDLIAAAIGDVNGDGESDVIASFRRPHRMTPFMELHPEVKWADAEGRDAHLGVYRPDGLVEIWVAGSVLLPIAALEVCDGTLALLHDQLDDPTPVATSAWEWNGFGFDTAPELPGPGIPGCADIDGDGDTDPVIRNRN